MDDAGELRKAVLRLEKLLAARFGVETGPLALRAARVGRRLPRGVRRDLALVGEAAQLAGHPRLGVLHDRAAVMAAAERARARLEAEDVADRRKGLVLGVLAGLAFNLMLLVVGLLWLLRWRGFL